MRSTLKKVLSVFFILTLLLPVAALAEDTGEETSEAVNVIDYFSGTALDLSPYEGKAILLNFFYRGCPYCMDEMDDIKLVFDTYDPDSLAIVLIHVWFNEDETDTATVVSKYGLEDMTVIEDEDLSLFYMVGSEGCPTNLFVDQSGNFYYGTYGMEYDGFAEILDALGVSKLEASDTSVETSTESDASQTDGTSE